LACMCCWWMRCTRRPPVSIAPTASEKQRRIRRRCICRWGMRELARLEAELPAPLDGFLRSVLLDPAITLPFLRCRASVSHHHSFPMNSTLPKCLHRISSGLTNAISDLPWRCDSFLAIWPPLPKHKISSYFVAEVIELLDQMSAASHNRRDLDHLLAGPYAADTRARAASAFPSGALASRLYAAG